MSARNILRDYLGRTTPEHGTIKWKAHAATVAACALVVPSLCAIYFWRAGSAEQESYWVWASLMMWRTHAAIVVVALLLWIFEKPKPTPFLPVKDGAVLKALGQIHWSLPLITMVLISIFFGWLTVSRFELAYDSWRWGFTGRAVGHILKGLMLFLFTLLVSFGPISIVVLCVRQFTSTKQKPTNPRYPAIPRDRG